MKNIDEMIRWYEQNNTRREYTLIKAKLRLIKSLLLEIEDSDDRMFMDEIIDNFAAIMELHRDVILDKEMELDSWPAAVTGGSFTHNYIASLPQQNAFANDKQLQIAFTVYLARGKKKPLSSYTINDYCSRIRNLWRSFYAAYRDGTLPKELHVSLEEIQPDHPLINASNYIEDLQYYTRWMSIESEEKKNWANTGAALNKFAEFIRQCR